MYLLVGANGFLSSNFQNLLNKKKKKFKTISSKKINLTSKSKSKLLKKIKGSFNVIFFAALTPDKGKGYNTFFENINILQNFLNNFNQESINHFTYISSDAVYNSNEILVNENTNTLPNDLYGTMHLSREKILKDYIDDDKKLTILRPTLIYGKGDTHNSYGPNRFLKQAKNESIINIFGKGLDKRDHISVHDVCRSIYLTTEKKLPGTFNVVTGKSTTFKNIAKLVIKYHSKNTRINFIKNNNIPSIRKYNSKKIMNIINNFTDLETGIKNYFKG